MSCRPTISSLLFQHAFPLPWCFFSFSLTLRIKIHPLFSAERWQTSQLWRYTVSLLLHLRTLLHAHSNKTYIYARYQLIGIKTLLIPYCVKIISSVSFYIKQPWGDAQPYPFSQITWVEYMNINLTIHTTYSNTEISAHLLIILFYWEKKVRKI